MTQYLPDTNVFIMAVKGSRSEANFLTRAIQRRKIAISSIVVAEFLVKADDNEQKSFEKLIAKFSVIPVDEEVARVAAEYRKQSFKTKRVHLLDCFLAAQAKLNNLTLVTNDKADFPMTDISTITP